MVDTVAGPIQGHDHDLEQVIDIDEVAAGVDDEARLTFAQPREEGGQRAAQIARPVDIRQAQGDEGNPRELDVLLAARLRDRVAGVRANRMLQRDRTSSGMVP